MYYNGLTAGYSMKNGFINSLVQYLKKNHEHAKVIIKDLQFHNLKFSQKGILDFMLLQPLLMYVWKK